MSTPKATSGTNRAVTTKATIGTCETPLGPVWVSVQSGAVVQLGWGMHARPIGDGKACDRAVLHNAIAAVEGYFAGRPVDRDLPIRPRASSFTLRVLDELRAIPWGETRRYGDLANKLNTPAQAIGQACGANPVPILIPCHRVLSASGLGGFSAPGGIDAKVWLLRHEGAASLLI